jgi:hypothetical protein
MMTPKTASSLLFLVGFIAIPIIAGVVKIGMRINPKNDDLDDDPKYVTVYQKTIDLKPFKRFFRKKAAKQ